MLTDDIVQDRFRIVDRTDERMADQRQQGVVCGSFGAGLTVRDS